MSKRRQSEESSHETQWCKEAGCINRVAHTCETCKQDFCVSHLIENIDAKVWYCAPCWMKEMVSLGYNVDMVGGTPVLTPIPRPSARMRSGSGEARSHVGGSGILETPFGDVYLTKGQLEFLFTPLP
jgi:hypothetical protein